MKTKPLLNILMNNGNCIVVRNTLPALLCVCVCAHASQSHTRIASLFKQSKGFVSEMVVTSTIGLLQRQIEKRASLHSYIKQLS